MKTDQKKLKLFVIAFALTFCYFFMAAQTPQGIFISPEDFNKDKLSFEKTNAGKCKIKLHELFFKPYITIRRNDSTYILKKDSVFGYKDKAGLSYRYFEQLTLTILNRGENILIYKHDVSSGSKGGLLKRNYYFSKNAARPVFPLTLKNLETAFKENKLFQEFLEIHFKDDSELTEYDAIHKMYKINRLLELSNTTKNN